jgi:hypothetical protein
MRKLGGISSDLLVRESRAVQAKLGDFAMRLPDCTSLSEIARAMEEGLAQVPFVARALLWIRPEGGTDEGIGALPVRQDEYLRAFHRFARRYPALRFMEHGGSRAADVAIWDDTWDASFPIFLRGEMIGVTLFLWKEKSPSFRQMELTLFLEGIGLAVENIRQKQRIQRREHATVGEPGGGPAHECGRPGVIRSRPVPPGRLPRSASSSTSSWRKRTG